MKGPSSNSDEHGFERLTADILRKYHNGSLTSREMHWVEKMLLEDPFAAEALEGIEAMDGSTSMESIESDLNRQVAARAGKRKANVIPIYQRPVNIAAALALLLVASYLLFNYTNLLSPSSPDSQGPIALEKSTGPEKSLNNQEKTVPDKNEDEGFDAVADTVANTVSDENESGESGEAGVGPNQDFQAQSWQDEKQAGQGVRRTEQKTGPVAAGEKEPDTEDVEIAEAETEQIIIEEAEIQEEAFEDTDLELTLAEKKIDGLNKADKTTPSVADEATNQKARTPQTGKARERAFSAPAKKAPKLRNETTSFVTAGVQKTISGQVIDAEDGHGMPGVSLSVKGTGKGVYTDINGYYELPVNNQDTVLVFSFVGYETEEIPLKGQEKIDLALEPDEMALEEVIVVAYGSEGEEDEFIPFISAEPVGGKSAYKRYLKDSLRYPSNALENKAGGKVKVTFFVQSDGKLSDFQVKRSLGFGYDDEVIRLIREGPAWQPAKKGDEKVKQKVRVKVKFKTP